MCVQIDVKDFSEVEMKPKLLHWDLTSVKINPTFDMVWTNIYLFIYLFIYSTTLSASQATQCRVIGKLVDNT
jgi:hypothetical protein